MKKVVLLQRTEEAPKAVLCVMCVVSRKQHRSSGTTTQVRVNHRSLHGFPLFPTIYTICCSIVGRNDAENHRKTGVHSAEKTQQKQQVVDFLFTHSVTTITTYEMQQQLHNNTSTTVIFQHSHFHREGQPTGRPSSYQASQTVC